MAKKRKTKKQKIKAVGRRQTEPDTSDIYTRPQEEQITEREEISQTSEPEDSPAPASYTLVISDIRRSILVSTAILSIFILLYLLL